MCSASIKATVAVTGPNPAQGDERDVRPLRVLTMTTLFPSRANPRHGIFVETRLRKLRERAPVELRVIAPVPWFPFAWRQFGRYATYASTPHSEERLGITVQHPRYLSIPRVGTALRPASLAAACWRVADALRRTGWQCDIVDAHYLYPDGVAAASVAHRLQRPLVVTARGSDVNLIAQMPGPRQRILDALGHAAKIIAVSDSLRQALLRLGVRDESIEVLRNGVDMEVFRPYGREAQRTRLGVGTSPLIASVGNLVEEKGHDLVLRAAARVPEARVVVVGEGPLRARLGALARDLGIHERVHFVGNMPQAELASIYSAADVLALASTREGWPNVVLEAMACGTPVVAMNVGGVPEILTDGALGEIVDERSDLALAQAIVRTIQRRIAREDLRTYAGRFSWDPVAQRYYHVLSVAALRVKREGIQ
jgi:glycosyltransferase involved in cell wall biosynthesis